MTAMSPHGVLVQRGMAHMSVDVTVIAGLILDAFEEAKAKYRAAQPDTVVISSVGAHIKATRDFTKPLRYHRLTCTMMMIPDGQQAIVGLEVAKALGTTPCAFCENLTLKQWCRTMGFDPANIWRITTGKKKTIRKTYAIQLLRAIGEEPHPSLLAYEKAA